MRGQPALRAAGALCALFVASCGSDTSEPEAGAPPGSVTVFLGDTQLFVTETRRAQGVVRDARGNQLATSVVWSSSNPAVLAVDTAGVVTGVAPCQADLKAQAGDVTSKLSVRVLERLGFAFPLAGTLNRHFFLLNYVDQQPATGLRDYNCGVKTYDGHQGTDITLATFAVMDSGVTILAAAPGTVSEVRDGLYDRNKVWGGPGFGNYVTLSHRDGFISIYGHMRQGSVKVTQGQPVAAGTPLGLVGSSGNSDVPHLHIEFQRNGAVVDGYAGPCGPSVDQWGEPLAYQDTFALMATGLANTDLTLDNVKDPPAQIDTFSTSDARIWMWVELFNARAGKLSRWELFDPSGTLKNTIQLTHGQFYSLSWWWMWQSIPGFVATPGTWHIDYYHGGERLAQRTFVLRGAIAALAPPGDRAPSGRGGGGWQPRPER